MMKFKKSTLVMLLICQSALTTFPVAAEAQVAAVAASTDVEATMKAMALAYKMAMAASDVPQMQPHIRELQQLVTSVQLHQFSADKQAKFQQGLTEVQQQLDLVQASLTANDLPQARQQLKQVDVLKKQYHKERSPSIWRLLFGM